jgi:hypothetical protein
LDITVILADNRLDRQTRFDYNIIFEGLRAGLVGAGSDLSKFG